MVSSILKSLVINDDIDRLRNGNQRRCNSSLTTANRVAEVVSYTVTSTTQTVSEQFYLHTFVIYKG